MRTSVVASSQPECSPPMTPAIELDAVVVGDDANLRVQFVFAPVESEYLLALPRPADDEIARHLGRIEDVQRAAAIESDVVRDVDKRVDRPEPDRDQALLHPSRAMAVLHAPDHPQREAGTERRRVAEFEADLHWADANTLDRLHRLRPQRSQAGGREIACDTGNARTVGAVRRQVDLDERVVEPRIGGKARPDRRIPRQVDDAGMVVRHLELALGAHHAAALDATNVADGERDFDAGYVGPGGSKGADQSRARIRRAADDLHRLASAGIHHQHLELVGVGMLFGGDDAGDRERLERRLVVHQLYFEPDHRQALDDLVERGVGFKMVLEPGECEFHDASLCGSCRDSR